MWPALTGSFAHDHGDMPPSRVHVDDAAAMVTISQSLAAHLRQLAGNIIAPVFVCIGTDRSTGDALGPLTGSALQERLSGNDIAVYGTLDEPVHATNLTDIIDKISQSHPRRIVVAIDACLGRSENVGYISVKPGPLRPGTGVNKKLPDIGDLHMVGVVNVGGFMEYFVLQNTRLSLVVRMASIIANSIVHCLSEERCLPTAAPHVAAGLLI